ncbi:MAG TPA: hypothetical protein VIV60_20445 [Polyangiaceae bacterium]
MKLEYRTVTRRLFAAVVTFLSVSALANQAAAQEFLFFASDIHDKKSDLLNHIETQCYTAEYGNRCEVVGLVGDFNSQDPTQFNSTPQDTNQLSLDIYMRVNWQLNNLVYSQGNHDESNEAFSSAGANTTGPVPLFDNEFYDIYRINSADFTTACPALQAHLATVTNKMLFVMSHYPLHSNRSDIDQGASDCIFSALSDAAGRGQDITFLWGHNHFRDGRPDYDSNVRMIAVPGQTIKIGSGSSYLNDNAGASLNFSYVNAGYVKTGSSTLFMLHELWMMIIRNGVGAEAVWVNR